MSEGYFRREEIRTPDEVAKAVEMAETFLPQESFDLKGPEGIMGRSRLFAFQDEILDKNVAGCIVERIKHNDGSETLEVRSGILSPKFDTFVDKTYTLDLSRGAFIVSRVIQDISVTTEKNRPPVDFKEQENLFRIESELGLLMPEPGDWEEYISLLYSARVHVEKHGRNNDQLHKADRLSRLFSKLRRK